jgi:transposase
MRIFVEIEVCRVACRRCGAVKRQRLDFLAENPRYTKRFAFYVGRRCRSAPLYDIAEELHLEWHTVKEVEMQYMREPLRRAGTPKPAAA